jgi:hypothetical protein
VGKLKKMIPGVIMTKRIIEPDIPRHIKIKRSCLTSPGTVRDMEFDLIYVNGDNNLENIRRPDET